MKQLALALLLVANLAQAGLRVEVEGHGATQDHAKKDAFRKATEQVVGVVVVSDQEAQGAKLTKDFMGNYSSGFIEDYEVLETYVNDDNQWVTRMNVKVSSNKIAERMLSRGQTSTNIDGQKLADSMASEIEMRYNGDALLSSVLSSYPENAYIINAGETQFKIGRLRQPYVDIPYKILMSKFWVEAFDEAVRYVAVDSSNCNTLTMSLAQSIEANPRNGAAAKNLAQKACGKDPDIRVFYKQSGDFFPKSYSYYLPDQLTLDTINDQFLPQQGRQHIGVRIDLIDASGSVFDSRCARVDNQLFINYSDPVGTYNLRDKRRLSRPNVMGQNNVYGTFRVHLHNTSQIENLARIKLSVQKTCD